MSNDHDRVSSNALLDSFDRVFIIHLPDRTDRMAGLEREFRYLGYPIDRVEFFDAQRPTSTMGFASLGARGCFESHLAILKIARERGLKNVLIIEDDLSFTRALKKRHQQAALQLKSLSWDILYLGHRIDAPAQKGPLFQPYGGEIETAHFVAFSEKAYRAAIAFLDVILTRPAGHPEGGPMHVDGAYSLLRERQTDLKTLIAVPLMGFQRPSDSDITPSANHPLREALKGPLRWLKLRWSRLYPS